MHIDVKKNPKRKKNANAPYNFYMNSMKFWRSLVIKKKRKQRSFGDP